jgi:hypothetical protein
MELDIDSRQRNAALGTAVTVVWYVYEDEDRDGNDVTWGIPVAIHLSAAEAKADVARRAGPPIAGGNADGKYVAHGPSNLLAFCQCGFAGVDALRALLNDRVPVELAPNVWYAPSYYDQTLKSPPLSDGEYRKASALQVWTVYYEDQFHSGQNRESYPVAVCFTEAEAQAEAGRRGLLTPGYDGHLVTGPHALAFHDIRSPDIGSHTVREVLRRLDAGEPGPVWVQ